MALHTLFTAMGVALGSLVIIGYIAVYIASSGARKRIEQPKHNMMNSDAKLWPKPSTPDQ